MGTVSVEIAKNKNLSSSGILSETSSEYTIIDSFKVNNIYNWFYEFRQPLFYSNPEKGAIRVVAKVTQLYKDTDEHSRAHGPILKDRKVITFLQGGPGFAAYTPLDTEGFIGILLEKGYTVVNYDQRGTGLSTPLNYDSLTELGQALGYDTNVDNDLDRYLSLLQCFRADSIVNDCESIRRMIQKDSKVQKWSIIGQSYGGFCANTYLSFYPDKLSEVFMTGGIPGIGKSVEDVYKATYQRVIERNSHYYARYPQDIRKVKNIIRYLYQNAVLVPNGGHLTVERFQQLGLNFGASGGTDQMHLLVFQFDYELSTIGFPSYELLTKVQNSLSFDTNVIYALFQEAIYLDGPSVASHWTATRLRYLPEHRRFFVIEDHLDSLGNDDWLNDDNKPLFFTGEMVFRSMFDDYAELRKFKKLADHIHKATNWSPIYNPKTLHTIYDSFTSFRQKNLLIPPNSPKKINQEDVNIVKVVAAVYYNDLYVDFNLSKHTIENQYGNIRPYVTSEFFHNGLRAGAKIVMERLFSLLENEVD